MVRETVFLHPNLREQRGQGSPDTRIDPQGCASAPPEASSKADLTADTCLTYANEFLGRSKSLLGAASPDR